MTPSRAAWSWRNPRDVFQAVSYLQYPLMLVALLYSVRPYLTGLDGIWQDLNYALLYAGIGIGLSSLQDPTRMQNEISRKVWQSPRKGRLMLAIMTVSSLSMILIGLVASYQTNSEMLRQVSMGVFSLGLGMVGILKTAIEMFEHHRLDKHATDENRLAQEKNA
jgi:magnesium-transporting ATPase (P-type)